MRKLYLFVLISISFTAVLFQGCMKFPSDVIAPQWDVDLNVPLATKSYVLGDIIKPQNYISIDPTHDSIYVVTSDQYRQSIGISNFITVSLQSSTASSVPVPDIGSATVYIAFPEGAKLNQAHFQSGTLRVVGHNTASSQGSLSITFPGILKLDSTKLVITVVIPPNNNNTVQVNLANYIYQEPANTPTIFKGQLQIQAAVTQSSGGNGISFDTYISDFVFNSVTGYLPTKSLGNKTNNFSLNLGDAVKYRDKVFLKTATLTMNGKYISPSSNPFVIKVDSFKVIGSRIGSSLTKQLSFNSMPYDTFRFDSNGNFTQQYTESNSNITDFITFLPDIINISASYKMNPDNSQAYKTATSSDSVTFTTNFSTTSALAVKQTSFADTLKLDIKQDIRDQIAKGKGVTASVDIQNAIPLNSWIKVTLADSLYNLLFVISKSASGADSISFPGASVDGNGNFVSPSSPPTTTISLDSVQIKLLAQRAHYAIISVTVETSGANNAPVIVRAKDWLKLNVFGKVTYRINEKD